MDRGTAATGSGKAFRRAGGAVAAAVLLSGLALPGILLAGAGRAMAASQQAGDGFHSAISQGTATAVAVDISGMSPRWAEAKSGVAVSGSLTNASKSPVRGVIVQLFSSANPVLSSSDIELGIVQLNDPADVPISGASWHLAGVLQPGQSVRWTIRFLASKIGMSAFGVYPLAAVLQNAAGTDIGSGTSSSYLPYLPAKKSGFALPAREQISWLWPLIDKPLLNKPWVRDNCTGAQAQALGQSLAPGGRLAGLVDAGQGSATSGRADAWASKSAQSKASRAEPAQSLAGMDGITWAVDPALLANARALSACRQTAPSLAKSAAGWLTALRAATQGQPLFAMPYADPNIVALIRQGHQGDVRRAFELGRTVTRRVLNRDVTPSRRLGSGSAQASQTSAIAWPAGGMAGYNTAENLFVDQVRTMVLNRSSFPGAPGTVVKALDGGGGYVTILLADDGLSRLLQSAGNSAGSAFATSQAFLAATAVLAAQQPGQPIIVAPPARWDPPAGLASDLLTGTSAAPWLSPVSLTALARAKSIPGIQLPAGSPGERSYSRRELRKLKVLGRQLSQLESIQATPDPGLFLPVSTIESSAWQGKSRVTAEVMLRRVAIKLHQEQRGVQIVAGGRITLGGLKGSVPVSIDNKLGFAIRVKLQLRYSQSDGMKIREDPPVVTISARSPQTIKLHVQATKVGSTTITMRLASASGQPLPAYPGNPARMTVQATQVGVLGMIIFASALGIFLVASAARAVRHGRPAPDSPAVAGGTEPDHLGSDQASDQAAARGEGVPGDAQDPGVIADEPATVVPEHSELGTAGTPGL